MTTTGRQLLGAEALRAEDETPLRRFVADFCENRIAVVALFVFVAIALAAVFAPLISIQNPYDLAQIDIMDGTMPPGSESASGATYLLGTDDQGRDMVSAILYGLRISLGVGAISGIVAMLLGVFAGIAAAQLGGWVDALIMRVVDIQLGFPAILIALILLAVPRPRRRQGDHRPRRVPMGVLRAGGSRCGAGGASQGVHRERALPVAQHNADRPAPPAAQLPSTPHRDRYG